MKIMHSTSGNKRQKTNRNHLLTSGMLAALLLAGCGQDSTNSASPVTTSEAATTAPQQKEEGTDMKDNSNTAKGTTAGKLRAEDIPTALLSGQTSQLYAQMTNEFKKQVSEKDLQSSKSMLQGIQSFKSLGDEIELNGELNGYIQYNWISDNNKLGLISILEKDGQIAGMQLQPIEQFPATDNTLSKTTYRMPFDGEWYVFWGGTNVIQNYHYAVESQRYAYDLVQVKDGMSYSGDPEKNESYYAFGQPVLAPADGKVVSIVNNIADNEPVGEMNPRQPGGNMVVIDHGGEYSILGHLQKGSVTVKPGDSVQSGDPIGKVGNSGNSSEAHMHFQVSSGPDIMTDPSIRIHWVNDLDPVKGETVDATNSKIVEPE
ncbi:M23 family metallopeptidase [Paenibacillus wulumuqiensis]|uniref:M23 family metallopeptidase n=1 Tax=Paenibacillus wulumuqiensis TaxID=1567107 RepID=UPI000AFB6764|nr:M23 family metallopeptidase [Paenibacillus wulumuqiensis]